MQSAGLEELQHEKVVKRCIPGEGPEMVRVCTALGWALPAASRRRPAARAAPAASARLAKPRPTTSMEKLWARWLSS